MKKIYTLLLALLITGLGFAQTTIYTQDFETIDDGYTASSTEGSGFTDVFNRTNPTVGGNSTFIWSIEDTNLTSPTITLDQIDITGYADFTFSLDMLAHHYNDWDSGDTFSITYSIDSGTSQNLLWVRNAGGTFNQAASIDTDFDGIGDCGAGILPAITTGNSGCNVTSSTFATFSSSTISLSTNTTLDIVLTFNGFTASDEGMYLDDIEVEGNLAGGGCTAPTTQATAYNTTSIGATSATLNWTDGNGDEVLVLVKEGSAVDTDPTDGISYTGNTAFTSGDQIGTGNYVVQSGSATSSVGITGLSPATTYHVAVYEYNTTDTCYELTQLTGDFTTTAVTTVQFSTTSISVAETAGTYDLVIEIANEDVAATTFDVVLTSGDTADIDSYTTQSESFPGSSTTDITVTVTITDDAIVEADEVFTFEIQTVAGGNSATVGTNNSFDLTILANDAPPPTDGWQITAEDTSFVIDFDSTVTEVNEGVFDGSGFTTSPSTGELDSDAWESTGLSDGALSYGGSETSGDYARGSSTGGVTSGGFYSFDTGGSNNTLGFQATGSDFTPGDITLRAQNQTGNIVTVADLAYLIYVDNRDGRSTTFDFSYSTDDTTYTDVAALDYASDAASDGLGWVSNSRSTSITGLSIADGDYLYIRWSSTDNGGSGSRDELALDDIDLKFNPVPPTTYTYTGTWSPSDPNGAALAGEFIVIASGNATIDTNTTCDSVIVNAGASLTVDTAITLTTTNGLAMESTSTSYSSLILNGTVTGTLTYERHVNINGSGTTGSNDLVSAPLTGQAFNDFVTANSNILNNGTLYLFGHFDKTTGDYATYNGSDTTTLDPGVGYRAASSDNGTFTFTGTANTGEVSVDIINSGPTEPAEQEWNLVGNPYPSYINVQDFLNHDVDDTAAVVTNLQLFDSGTAAIYGYDGTALNGWTVYNLANTTASTVIAPGQGFFVSADATNAPLHNLEFTPAMRSTGTADDFIAGRNAAGGGLTFLTLNASTTNDSYETQVYFNDSPLATLGFNFGFDAELFNNPPFVLYTSLVEFVPGNPTQLALQSINTTDLADTTIPVGLRANQGEQVTFSLTENTLPITTEIFLDDNVAMTTTLLNTSDYVFTPSAAIDGTGRFFLRIFDATLSTIENTLDTLSIFALNNEKEIVVKGQLQENTVLSLYDIQGRKVLSTQLDNSSLDNRIDTSGLSGGVYIVTIQDNSQQKSEKVIIK